MDNLIEQFVDEDSEGIFAISLVSNPAIERNFIALSKAVKLSLDNEKRLVTGAILVPDQPILRMDGEGNPYHIFFSKETVEKASQKYLRDFNQAQVTLEHQSDVPDVVLVESWLKISDTEDKTVALGVDAPLGSWVGSFKVNNNEVWENEIKKGLVKGFSIEGIFRQDEVEQSKTKIMEKDTFIEKFKEFVLGKEEPAEVALATQEEVTKLCTQVNTLEETIKSLQAQIEKLSEVPEEVKEEIIEEVVEVKPEAVEVVEEPKEEEKVEMIAVTDAVNETKLKSVKFDPYMTAQERIRQALIK